VPDLPPGWVSGTLPRRGQREKAHTASDRATRSARRASIGTPLAAAVRPPSLSPLFCVLMVVAVGLALAAVVVGVFWILIVACCVLGGAAVLEAKRRRNRAPLQDDSLDEAVAAADACLLELAVRIPESAMPHLSSLKRQLAEALAAVREARDMPPDDRFFVAEAVRRYVPDMCAHYRALADVPTGDAYHHSKGVATESLCRQLDEIGWRLHKIVADAMTRRTQGVLRHEEFLRSKR
jgi:hypothetical protein